MLSQSLSFGTWYPLPDRMAKVELYLNNYAAGESYCRVKERHCMLCCSPCLKLKPHSKGVKAGFLTVNVEPYGGGLWHTWFDRDLSVAGRVLIRDGDRLVHKLVRLPPHLPASEWHPECGLRASCPYNVTADNCLTNPYVQSPGLHCKRI